MNRRPGTDLIVIRAVVIHRYSFSIPYPYDFHCTSMDEVTQTLKDLFDIWPLCMRLCVRETVDKKNNESSSKNALGKFETKKNNNVGWHIDLGSPCDQ